MGIFDRILSGSSTPAAPPSINVHEAWAICVFGMAFSDGSMSEIEQQAIIRMLLTKSQVGGVGGSDRVVNAYRKFLPTFQSSGLGDLIRRACVEIPAEDRPTVFALCCEVVMADGLLTDDERSMLETLAQAMELPEDTGGMIVQVMTIRAKGSLQITD